MKAVCSNCFFYIAKGGHPVGFCRRYPPSVRGTEFDTPPLTCGDSWCGEHIEEGVPDCFKDDFIDKYFGGQWQYKGFKGR